MMTEDIVPTKVTQIGVKGRIGIGFNWKGRNYGLGMYEKDRRRSNASMISEKMGRCG